MTDNPERAILARRQFPMGFRFVPEEEELVGIYLVKGKMGTLTQLDKSLVPDCDLYGEKEPWEIWEMCGGRDMTESEDLFFFTKLKKKSSNGNASNINRLVGASGGKWHGVDSGEIIKVPTGVDDQDCIMGFRRRFSYKNPNSDQNGRWILHEYTLKELNDDEALCRLRKKHSAAAAAAARNDEAEILVKGPAKNKRKSEFEETADANSNKLLHAERKLNENETLRPNEEVVVNAEGNQKIGLITCTNDEGATIEVTALTYRTSAAGSNDQENIGFFATDDDDGFPWEGMEQYSFSLEELLGGPTEDMDEMNSGLISSLQETGFQSLLLDGTETLPQLTSTIASEETDNDTTNLSYINGEGGSFQQFRLQDIQPNLVQPTDIEMIPNKFYMEYIYA